MNPQTEVKPIPQQVIVKLHARLQARYGHRWTSQYPTTDVIRLATAEWADYLAGMSQAQLDTGMRTWDGEWPPTLPEFRRACLGISEMPTCNEDWARIGAQVGCRSRTGEGWQSYIGRVRAAINNPGAGQAMIESRPRGNGPRRIGHELS